MSGTAEEGSADHLDRAATRATGACISLMALAIGAFGNLVHPERMGDFFSPTSAGLIPAVVLLALVICGIALMIHPDATLTERSSIRSIGLKLLALLYLFAYIWALSAWGWLPASLALLVSLPLLAGYRNLLAIAVTTIVVGVSIWAVFIVGIGVPLP